MKTGVYFWFLTKYQYFNMQPDLISLFLKRNNVQDDSEDSSSCGSFADAVRQNDTRPGPPPQAQAPRRKRAAAASVSVCSSVNGNTSDDGSYVPGMDFDPKNRPFSQEELRPQPMSKKSKKQVCLFFRGKDKLSNCGVRESFS